MHIKAQRRMRREIPDQSHNVIVISSKSIHPLSPLSRTPATMKSSLLPLIALLLASASSFSPFAPHRLPFTTQLFSTDVVEPETAEAPAPPAFRASLKKGQTADVKKRIASATSANFAAVSKELESELSSTAGRNFLSKSRSRLANQAKNLGIDFDAKAWAGSAEAEAVRKAKQDEYVKAKIEEAANAVEEEVRMSSRRLISSL